MSVVVQASHVILNMGVWMHIFWNICHPAHIFLFKEIQSVQKSVFLFWLLNMTIRSEHVHRLELRVFFNFVLRIYQLGEK